MVFGGGSSTPPALASMQMLGLASLLFRLGNISRWLLCMSEILSQSDYREGVFCRTVLHCMKGAGPQTIIYWLHHHRGHTSYAEGFAKLEDTKTMPGRCLG